MTVSDIEKDKATECCRRYKLCPTAHVISPASDNTVFYDAFYEILKKNLEVFSSDLDTRTSTRQIHAIKCELNYLIEKLQSRNTSVKSPLTKQCLEIIEAYVFDNNLNQKEYMINFIGYCANFVIFFCFTDRAKMVSLGIGSLETNCIYMETNS